jgi:hypothetical protein
MSDFKWEEILRNCITDNKIKASYLQHIPHLKTCETWAEAKFIGRINHKFKYTSYDGGLVKLAGRIYYINLKQIQAISTFIKWDTSNIIKVIEDI